MSPELPSFKTPQRNDIQGLRAVAVLSVILFHFETAWLPGGFVGVDLFFVISGFLITRQLLNEIETSGQLNIFAFWGRRAKRLLPNAILTLLFVLAASALLLPAYRYNDISRQVSAAASFTSNFTFAKQAVDYFRLNDAQSPVLHFWSLSIEEQFYIALPLLLIGIIKCFPEQRVRAATVAIGTVCVCSLAYSLWLSSINAHLAFFYTASRIWQLAAGGLTGLVFARMQSWPIALRATLGIVGALAFLACCLLYDAHLGYPGLWAIAPTLAAAFLLIGAPAARPLNAFLSTSAMKKIGDRSYSLYLWHFPLLALAGERWPESIPAKIIAACLSVALALLAYRYVEHPIRISDRWPGPTRRLGLAALAILATCFFSFGLTALPRPTASAARSALIEAASTDYAQSSRCHLGFDDTAQPPCAYGNLQGRHTVLLFGDSHAGQWLDAVIGAADASGWKVLARTKTSCPAADVSIWAATMNRYYSACDIWRSDVLKSIAQSPPDLVIVGNYSHYDGWLSDPGTHRVLSPDREKAAWRRGSREMIETLLAAGSHVLVIRDNPMMGRNYKDCLSVTDACGRDRVAALDGMDINPTLFAAHPDSLAQLDLTDLICNGSWCPAMRDGSIIYQDQHHLTKSFAKTFWPEFAKRLALQPIGSSSPEPLNPRSP